MSEDYDIHAVDVERELEDREAEMHERMTILFGDDDEGPEYLVERWADGHWTLAFKDEFGWTPKMDGVTIQ